MHSTVKVYCFSVSPNYMRPWTKLEGESFTGSGCAIEGPGGHGYILTNSHVVRDHQLLQVQRHDRPGKWICRLLLEGIQCDLALLAVDDKRFWEGLPLQRVSDAIPALQHVVTAVGYPVGGENLCVTRGVVSRVDLLD
jgi:S1-C subfamily serine protease